MSWSFDSACRYSSFTETNYADLCCHCSLLEEPCLDSERTCTRPPRDLFSFAAVDRRPSTVEDARLHFHLLLPQKQRCYREIVHVKRQLTRREGWVRTGHGDSINWRRSDHRGTAALTFINSHQISLSRRYWATLVLRFAFSRFHELIVVHRRCADRRTGALIRSAGALDRLHKYGALREIRPFDALFEKYALKWKTMVHKSVVWWQHHRTKRRIVLDFGRHSLSSKPPPPSMFSALLCFALCSWNATVLWATQKIYHCKTTLKHYLRCCLLLLLSRSVGRSRVT